VQDHQDAMDHKFLISMNIYSELLHINFSVDRFSKISYDRGYVTFVFQLHSYIYNFKCSSTNKILPSNLQK
jgi:hypothetical protein